MTLKNSYCSKVYSQFLCAAVTLKPNVEASGIATHLL